MMLLVLAGAASLGRRRASVWPDGWMWPVPDAVIGGVKYPAVISDGYGSTRPGGRIHTGVDVMYRRRSLVDRPEYPSKVPAGSPWHFMPKGCPVVAARDGVVWSSGVTARGGSVVISHGAPWATYYTHLASLAFPPHAHGVNTATGKPTVIRAGDVIGTIGDDPIATDPRHLHFAVWYGGTDSSAVDPGAQMRSWRRVPWTFTPTSIGGPSV